VPSSCVTYCRVGRRSVLSRPRSRASMRPIQHDRDRPVTTSIPACRSRRHRSDRQAGRIAQGAVNGTWSCSHTVPGGGVARSMR
jgi:hypothetical protein